MDFNSSKQLNKLISWWYYLKKKTNKNNKMYKKIEKTKKRNMVQPCVGPNAESKLCYILGSGQERKYGFPVCLISTLACCYLLKLAIAGRCELQGKGNNPTCSCSNFVTLWIICGAGNYILP